MSGQEEFKLDGRLQGDTVKLVSWPLCDVLLMNDAQYPWVILVPRRGEMSEVYQLEDIDQKQLFAESVYLGRTMMSIFSGEKLNVAALGNVVNQLHVHHVIRFANDISWPAPVWGKHPPRPYTESELSTTLGCLQSVVDKVWG